MTTDPRHAAEAFYMQPAPDYDALFERFMAKLKAKLGAGGLVWEYASSLKLKHVRGSVVCLTVPTTFAKHILGSEGTCAQMLALWQEDNPDTTKVEIEKRSLAQAPPARPATPEPASVTIKVVIRQPTGGYSPPVNQTKLPDQPSVTTTTDSQDGGVAEDPSSTPPHLLCAAIQWIAAQYFEVNQDELICNWKAPKVVRFRQVAIFLTKELTSLPPVEVGELFDGLDASLVESACEDVRKLAVKDISFAYDLDQIRERIRLEKPEERDDPVQGTDPENRPRILIEDIQRVVARYYHSTRQEMVSQRRTRLIVKPRQIAMYLAKMLTPRSFPEIGRRFGGRDHTTVLYAVRKIAELLLTDDEKLQKDIRRLREILGVPETPVTE